MMYEWNPSNFTDGALDEVRVCYRNPRFPGLHFSRTVLEVEAQKILNVSSIKDIDVERCDHMATNDGMYYYFGNYEVFNSNDIPEPIKSKLKAAWNDYFSVG